MSLTQAPDFGGFGGGAGAPAAAPPAAAALGGALIVAPDRFLCSSPSGRQHETHPLTRDLASRHSPGGDLLAPAPVADPVQQWLGSLPDLSYIRSAALVRPAGV